MGDYDTMLTAFLMDTALYYVFVASPLYRKGSMRLLQPPFYPKHSNYAFRAIRFYQSRLVSIAQRKLKLGIYGNRNARASSAAAGLHAEVGHGHHADLTASCGGSAPRWRTRGATSRGRGPSRAACRGRCGIP
jgi:hypothetical protein